jgi:invasion protein IalB
MKQYPTRWSDVFGQIAGRGNQESGDKKMCNAPTTPACGVGSGTKIVFSRRDRQMPSEKIAAGGRRSKSQGFAAIAFAALAWVVAQPQAHAAGETPQVAPANGGETLPGGASSLNETHTDWSVNCAVRDNRKSCVFFQSQTNSSNQRVLLLELTASAPEKVTGSLVLPFGLALNQGVKLLAEDTAPGAPLEFKTCLPAGCIVPIDFGADTVAALRESGSLNVHAAAADGGGEIAFTISLKGFSAALDRTIALAN